MAIQVTETLDNFEIRTTAICNYCGRPATGLELATSHVEITGDGCAAPAGVIMDNYVTRSDLTIIYTCGRCADKAINELLELHESETNLYEPDRLAQAVSESFFANYSPEKD